MIHLLITILVAALVIYLFNRLVPLDNTAKTIINVILALILLVVVLRMLGIWV